MWRYKLLVLISLIFFLLFSYFIIVCNKHKKYKLNTKCWVINLDKNIDRYKRFKYYYDNSDLSKVPLERLAAVYGKDLDIKQYVTPKAYDILLTNEKNKYRTRHYELTRGAIGCFISHASIYRKLLDDPMYNHYIIFEDDAAIMSRVYDRIAKAIYTAPSDWDIILFSPIMEVLIDENYHFKKFQTFWGLCGYAISKQGAQKCIDEFDKNNINMQIDSKLSLMIMQGKLNVYGYKDKILWHDRTQGTDIQMMVKPVIGINPYYIEDL
jgi:GR25 family glycosyltransferase involved in LPS biosynthesis